MHQRCQQNLERLTSTAKKLAIAVETIDTVFGMGEAWHGLYIRDEQWGPAIALNAQLDPEWKTWVLAHELGHHHHTENLLIPPFLSYGAHKVDEASKKRWGSWRRLDPEEEKANTWAAKFLIKPAEWARLEEISPCDIRAILRELGLPLPAAIAWERVQRATDKTRDRRGALVRLSEEDWDWLTREVTGKGGHQGFLRRQLKRRDGDNLMLSLSDFGYARERAARVSGGWLKRYNAILNGVRTAHREGRVFRELFVHSITA